MNTMQYRTEWFELESLPGGCSSTVGNLASYLELGVKFGDCGHIFAVERRDLARRFGKDQPLAGLKPKLRCVPCDRRGNSVFVVAKLPR